MRINHNIAALNTYRQLGNANNAQMSSMEKLSSGLRINRAGDDAAGLAISEKMRGQIRGLDMAAKNAQDGVSLIQTAEGALNETHAILQRMRELATQAANDTNTDIDRGEIQKEINQLTSEINRIGNTTEFNTQKLLDGGGKEIAVNTTTAGVDAVKGQYRIDLSGLSTDQSITVDGTEVTYNTDIATTISDLKSKTEITDKYDIAVNGNEIIFTQKVASDTQANISSTNSTVNGTVSTLTSGDAGTQGVYTFDLDVSKLKDGQKIVVDSKEYTFKSDGTGDFKNAAELVAAINDDGEYTVGESNGTFTLTQVTPSSKNAPEVSVKSDGFSASFQIGANAGQSMTIDVRDMRATSDALKVASEDGTTVTSKSGKTASYTTATDVTNGTNNTGTFKALDVSSHDKASAAIDVINDAIEQVSAERSKLGAYQNRLEHTINNLGTASENLTAAESRIRDVDMAKEMMEQTKNAILAQASQAMLAQANQLPQGVLQLLR